jgi:hypothetical protein
MIEGRRRPGVEALTNWIGRAYSDGYPKRNLRRSR